MLKLTGTIKNELDVKAKAVAFARYGIDIPICVDFDICERASDVFGLEIDRNKLLDLVKGSSCIIKVVSDYTLEIHKGKDCVIVYMAKYTTPIDIFRFNKKL